MTTIRIPALAQLPLPPRLNARNGRYPTAQFTKAMIDLANQAVAIRTKEVARFFAWVPPNASTPTIPGSAGAGERNRWNSAFHSSSYVSHLWAVITVAGATAAGLNPSARIRCRDTSPATIADATIHAGAALLATSPGGPGDTPAFYTTALVPFLDPATGLIAGITQDVDLTLTFSDFNNGRLVNAMVYEEAVAAATEFGYSDPGVAVALGPIFDATRENLAGQLVAQWKSGACHLFNWSDSFATFSTTPTNIIDGTSTVASGFTPGFTVDLTNLARLSAVFDGVKVTMFVFAQDTSGGFGVVRLFDNSLGVVGSVNGFGASPSWRSSSFFVPAAVAKYDLQAFRTSGGTITVLAVSVFVYDV